VWIVALVVAAALAGGVYLFVRRRRAAARAMTAWRTQLADTNRDLKTARDLLEDAATGPIEPSRLESLRHQADAAAAALGHLRETAPDDVARTHTENAEQALRSFIVAVDAEQLLRDSVPPASEDALADANVTRRSRAAALDDAISKLDELIQPGTTDAGASEPGTA
jgi:hypothetical protein